VPRVPWPQEPHRCEGREFPSPFSVGENELSPHREHIKRKLLLLPFRG